MNKFSFSKRILDIPEAISQKLLSKVRNLKKLNNKIHDFSKQKDTPKIAINTVIKSLKLQENSISSDIRGVYGLREAISKKLFSYNNLRVDPDKNILITVGAKEAILSSLFALIDQGDEVIIEDPGYLSFLPLIKLVGGIPKRLELKKNNGFKISISNLLNLINTKTKLLILCNPHNPTGRCLSYNDLKKISDICIKYNLNVLLDEAYEHFVYNKNKHYSLASFPGMFERSITIQTVSKIYNMSGWRIGWVVGSNKLIEKILIAHSHAVTSPTTFAQIGVIPVIEQNIGEGNEKINIIVKRYEKQRDYMISFLKSIDGIDCHYPDGTFFAFPDISSFGFNSNQISNYLLDKANVASVPGVAFGPSGEGFLRMVFKSDLHSLELGLDKMSKSLKKLPNNMDKYLL